jgi:WD40 repeat protein
LRDYDAISWWNAVTGVHQCTLPNIDGFGPLAISPDSVHLAITNSQFTDPESVELWHTRTGTRNSVLYGHKGRAIQIVFSPDSQQVAVASTDRTVRVWDTRTGLQLHNFRTDDDIPEMVRFSHNGHTIAAASSERTIRLWDIATGRYLQMIQYEKGFLQEMAFSRNELRILLSETNHDNLWDPWNTLTLPVSTYSYPINYEATASEPGFRGVHLDENEIWIMKDSERIVLIPPKYRSRYALKRIGNRAKSWASRGPVLFIGCLSGRVIQFRNNCSQ